MDIGCGGTGQIGFAVDISDYCPCPGCKDCEERIWPKRKYVAAIFPNSSKPYDFFTVLNLKRGDKVVVNTVHGLAIATVDRMLSRSSKANNWVIQRVDIEAFEQFKTDFKQAMKADKLKGRNKGLEYKSGNPCELHVDKFGRLF